MSRTLSDGILSWSLVGAALSTLLGFIDTKMYGLIKKHAIYNDLDIELNSATRQTSPNTHTRSLPLAELNCICAYRILYHGPSAISGF